MAVCLALGLIFSYCGLKKPPSIKIGLNIPLTGPGSKTGAYTQDAARLWAEKINAGGGIKAGHPRYIVELIIADNASKAESAAVSNGQLITRDQVAAIISQQAFGPETPAIEMAEQYKTPLIYPWPLDPKTTANRLYVFQAGFSDPSEALLCAQFIKLEFSCAKAAVIYDILNDYSQNMASFFRTAWEKVNGPGTVVAYEHFTTQDTDFSSPLTKIMHSEAEVLFVPQWPHEAALIVKQARALGWDKPIVGSNIWSAEEFGERCNQPCRGLFFSTHFTPSAAFGPAAEFINQYKTKYGHMPEKIGALTWDSMSLLEQAIMDCGHLTGNPVKDRQCIRDALANIKDFEGITGKMTYNGIGDPVKCGLIIKINEQGKYVFYKSVCPP